MLISEWHIFFEFLLFSWSKFFLTVVNEYAKNQRNSGHSVVSSISATYGKVAAKFSKNNLSLVYIVLHRFTYACVSRALGLGLLRF